MTCCYRKPPLPTLLALSLGLLAAATTHAQGPRRPGSGAPGGPGGASASTPLFGGGAPREVHGPSLSATDEMVVDIVVEGNETVPAGRVLSQLETRVGRPYDPRALGRDVKKLASLPWFVDVRPLSRETPEGRVVIFRVAERATVRYVEYLGNAKLKDKKLAKETGLKVGAAIDPYAVEDAKRLLQDLYAENGYPRAQVEVLEGNRVEDRGIVFVINEGVQQKIAATKFEGNNSDFASDRRLRTKVKSKRGVLWLFGGKFKREVLDADVQALTAYYRSFGFFQAKVDRVIDFNDDGTWATIRFVIHEGPRYQVRSVRFLGNEKFSDESLGSGLKLPAGVPFEQAKLTADIEWLKEVYGSHGYVFADVRAEPVFLEEPGELDLVYHFGEGEKWRVGRIFVHIGGENPHTRVQTALNRLSIRPGEVMDIRELRASERRLQASNLFLSEPARGVTPKITYRIPELDTEFQASAGRDDIRGQSPEPQTLWGRVFGARKPSTSGQTAGDSADIHLVVGGADPGQPRQVIEVAPIESSATHRSPAPKRHTVRKPPIGDNVYARRLQWQSPANAPPAPTPPQNTIAARPVILGQSPAPSQAYGSSPYSQPAYGAPSPFASGAPQQQAAAYVPPSAPAGYGGVAPRAVSPSAAQAGYNQPVGQAGSPVQQVQFSGPTPPAGAPAARVMGAPYTNPQTDPSILPIPENPALFPGGQFGNFVDLDLVLQEAQTGRFMVGVGVNSDAGVVGQILIDERNFDWRKIPTSFQDIYNGTAFRGDGQRFRIEAAPGTQVQRYLVNWQDPYWRDLPISLGISGSYFTRRFRDYDEQRLGTRVSTGYQWVANDLSAALAYRYANVEIFDETPGVPEFEEVADRNNQLHGVGVTITNDTRNNPFLATDGHFVSL
ncbi:MAG: POTRA domain-containing protein, partial [Planctomycetota bacterium]